MSFHAPQVYMCSHPLLGNGHGNNGYFKITFEGAVLHVISSDGGGWEHVSVSLSARRCPTWDEMCYIKKLFWDDEDCVVQYHPPKSQYVNNVNNCLHLWRQVGKEFAQPDSSLVGLK